jgi:hypothetical protein
VTGRSNALTGTLRTEHTVKACRQDYGKKLKLDRINRIDRIFLLFPEETTKYSSPSAKNPFQK